LQIIVNISSDEMSNGLGNEMKWKRKKEIKRNVKERKESLFSHKEVVISNK